MTRTRSRSSTPALAMLTTTATLAAMSIAAGCTAGLSVPGLQARTSSGSSGSTSSGATSSGATSSGATSSGATSSGSASSGSASSGSTSAASTMLATEGELQTGPIGFGRCKNPGTLDAQMDSGQTTPVLSAPSNPWDAVDHGVPAALPLGVNQRRGASFVGRGQVVGCDAAHDHCLSPCTWFVSDPRTAASRLVEVRVAHRRVDGTFQVPVGVTSTEFDPASTAYRTVPATRRLLVPGRKIAVQADLPESETMAFSAWTLGELLRVDDAAGTVQLKGSKDVYPLAATRVVVMTSHGGGPVELPAGLTNDDLVVRVDEVFLP